MNREILFKGKRTDNGEWVEGLLGRYNSKFECANIIDEFVRISRNNDNSTR